MLHLSKIARATASIDCTRPNFIAKVFMPCKKFDEDK
jgi:hypothetical protein